MDKDSTSNKELDNTTRQSGGSEQGNYIKLGLFVAVGIALFITGIFLVGSKNLLFTNTYLIKARFHNVGGLKPGSNVHYNGVKVGVVKDISILNDTTVEVTMQIQDSKRGFIQKNAVASISSDGLMGDKLINIEAGTAMSAEAEDGDIIKSRNSLNTDAMMQTLNATNQNVKAITDNLKSVTDDLNNKNGTIQQLYKDSTMAINLKKTALNLEAMSAEVRNVGATLQKITAKMQTGKSTVSTLLNDTTMGSSLSSTIEQLKQTSDKLNSAGDQLTKTFTSINSGKGSVNALLNDSGLTNNVKLGITNFKKAAKDLDDDVLALRHNIFFRGAFKNKDTSKRKR